MQKALPEDGRGEYPAFDLKHLSISSTMCFFPCVFKCVVGLEQLSTCQQTLGQNIRDQSGQGKVLFCYVFSKVFAATMVEMKKKK